MIGRVVGHYRIASKLGQGGMGVVFRARDEVLQRDVALKFVGEALAQEGRERLLHEARAASRLNHPNICTVHEIGEIDDEFYIVMELIEGNSLSSLLREGGLAYESVMRYGGQLANALAHAHGRSIVHRDLKSHNVMVTPHGLVKVLDFGLARSVMLNAHDEEVDITATLDSTVATGGTVSYMAPELLRGAPGDHRSDFWALGVVLYETATGHLPFEGRTAAEIAAQIMRDPPPPLPARIPLGLSAVILRCLAKEPALRYQSANEVLAAIEALQSAAASPRPPQEQEPAQLTPMHRGIRHLSVKNGDVLLLVGTAKGLFLLRSSPRRARWDVAGPYFPGQATYALALDAREGRHCIWAASSSTLWGAFIRSSDDYGKTWTNPVEAPIRFPSDSGATLKNIWQICPGPASEPNVMYCGVEPAALFESNDHGKTWSLVRALFDHPHRSRWVPGMGGLCLHTVLLDPQDRSRMLVAISAGGVYATDDGGRTWEARNRGVRVTHMPEKYPEFGQCGTRSRCTRYDRNDSFCRTTGDCTDQMTAAVAGAISAMVCLRISDLQW
jgi:serine/threonine protein kinase